MVAGGWEWSLYQWQENNDERYDLKTANPCTSDFANALLEADERFFKYCTHFHFFISRFEKDLKLRACGAEVECTLQKWITRTSFRIWR